MTVHSIDKTKDTSKLTTSSSRLATVRNVGSNPPKITPISNQSTKTTKITNHNENFINICTFNTRTLSTEERQQELKLALCDIKWDLIGLSETRLFGQKILEFDNEIFCYIGETKG